MALFQYARHPSPQGTITPLPSQPPTLRHPPSSSKTSLQRPPLPPPLLQQSHKHSQRHHLQLQETAAPYGLTYGGRSGDHTGAQYQMQQQDHQPRSHSSNRDVFDPLASIAQSSEPTQKSPLPYSPISSPPASALTSLDIDATTASSRYPLGTNVGTPPPCARASATPRLVSVPPEMSSQSNSPPIVPPPRSASALSIASSMRSTLSATTMPTTPISPNNATSLSPFSTDSFLLLPSSAPLEPSITGGDHFGPLPPAEAHFLRPQNDCHELQMSTLDLKVHPTAPTAPPRSASAGAVFQFPQPYFFPHLLLRPQKSLPIVHTPLPAVVSKGSTLSPQHACRQTSLTLSSAPPKPRHGGSQISPPVISPRVSSLPSNADAAGGNNSTHSHTYDRKVGGIVDHPERPVTVKGISATAVVLGVGADITECDLDRSVRMSNESGELESAFVRLQPPVRVSSGWRPNAVVSVDGRSGEFETVRPRQPAEAIAADMANKATSGSRHHEDEDSDADDASTVAVVTLTGRREDTQSTQGLSYASKGRLEGSVSSEPEVSLDSASGGHWGGMARAASAEPAEATRCFWDDGCECMACRSVRKVTSRDVARMEQLSALRTLVSAASAAVMLRGGGR